MSREAEEISRWARLPSGSHPKEVSFSLFSSPASRLRPAAAARTAGPSARDRLPCLWSLKPEDAEKGVVRCRAAHMAASFLLDTRLNVGVRFSWQVLQTPGRRAPGASHNASLNSRWRDGKKALTKDSKASLWFLSALDPLEVHTLQISPSPPPFLFLHQ